MTKTTTKAPKDSEKALAMWGDYLTKDVVNNFQAVPIYAKLTFLQNIPYKFIDFRPVGNTEIPYIKHEFAEKALNFAFNFNVNVEVERSEAKRGKGSTGKGYTEVTMQVKFTFHDEGTGRDIIRTVFSGHKGYDNPATTEADVFKAALSKAYTVVARTFGIGSNVKETTKGQKEKTTKLRDMEAKAHKETKEEPKEIKKSFGKDNDDAEPQPQW